MNVAEVEDGDLSNTSPLGSPPVPTTRTWELRARYTVRHE
jgi:hypothetical protein